MTNPDGRQQQQMVMILKIDKDGIFFWGGVKKGWNRTFVCILYDFVSSGGLFECLYVCMYVCVLSLFPNSKQSRTDTVRTANESCNAAFVFVVFNSEFFFLGFVWNYCNLLIFYSYGQSITIRRFC